jgi:rhamnulokinase
MKDPSYVAVDLGAGSGRVLVASFAPSHLSLEEVRRFQIPSHRNGRLEWRSAELFDEVQAGLRQAARFAKQSGASISSIGVDSWGVDYGLIDAAGNLCEEPICYRDKRTEGMMEKVFERMPRDEIYARTGIQFLGFNTLYQLAAHVEAGVPKSAVRLLLIPDLIHFWLTGAAFSEYTNASTTQMLSAGAGSWDLELLQRLGLPAHLLPEIVRAGTDLGPLKSSLAGEFDLGDARVVAPATHDTASAVVGAPLEEDFAYISSGTWSLVGVERDSALINSDTACGSFTNEGGAFGTVRFLKNVMGLWIFESCRKEWSARGIDVHYGDILGRLDVHRASASLIFPDDPRFLGPPSMLGAIADQLKETQQTAPEDPLTCTKVILDSLAFRYASVLRTIEFLTRHKIQGIQIFGGGSRNDYLNQATANITGIPVVAGPVEAAAIGNSVVQAIRAGCFRSLSHARRYVAANINLKRFMPHSLPSWAEAVRRYDAIEARYSSRELRGVNTGEGSL